MRYEIRWSNGYWKIFDTQQYRGVAVYGLKKDAQAALDAEMKRLAGL